MEKEVSTIKILAVVLGVLTVFTLALGSVLVASNGHPERLFGGPAETERVPQSFAGKLAGATESTDAHGVVHGKTAAGVKYLIYGRTEVARSGEGIRLAATGDVLATEMNMPLLDAYSGETDDGVYDFGPYYQEIAPALADYDICFVNQETAMAGNTDGFSYSVYPLFNSPESSIQAMSDAGFNVVNFNSNHTYDMGAEGIERSQGFFSQYPKMMVVGSYASQADRDTVRMIQRGDMTIAFLSYCYGSNMYGDTPDVQPNNYYACIFDKKAMSVDIARAQSVADAVVVYMHWGTEEQTEPDKRQLEYAQFLVDLDVDLVLGSHAHLCQTVKNYTSPTGKTVPVVFGMSDLISGWTLTETIFSGLVTCDFVRKGDDVVVENLVWHPLVEWSDGGDVYVRMLEHMDDAAIQKNTRTEDIVDDVAFFREKLESLDMDCTISWK